jgi:hypothetical protein
VYVHIFAATDFLDPGRRDDSSHFFTYSQIHQVNTEIMTLH